MWRKVKIFLAIYLAANLIGAYLFWPRIDQYFRFMPSIEKASFETPSNELAAQQQDFSYLLNILDYDRSFSDAARVTFRDKLSALKSDAALLSDAKFYLTVRELMALADNGHTGGPSGPAFRDFNRSGVDSYWFDGRLFIVRAHRDHLALLGKEIVKIEGADVQDVRAALLKYTGGSTEWRNTQNLFFLRSPELLHAAGLAAAPDFLNMAIADENGVTRDIQLRALPKAPDAQSYFRHAHLTLAPGPLNDEVDGWVRILNEAEDEIAPYLIDIFDVNMSQVIEGGLYLRSAYLMDSPENPIKKQLLQTLEAAPESGYEFMIVDLRWNPGGDYSNAIAFAQRAIDAVASDGKIYVVVGPNTFSAAIVFAALLEKRAPERTLIVGEPMGDRAQFWAERGGAFVLPNSLYWINYATGFHDWENGCAKTHKYCFTPNHKHEGNAASLELDKRIEPSFDDYASGRDVVMEWVLNDHGGDAT